MNLTILLKLGLLILTLGLVTSCGDSATTEESTADTTMVAPAPEVAPMDTTMAAPVDSAAADTTAVAQ